MLATMAWQAVSGSLSFGRARIQRRQCNMGAAFIHKDQPVRLALLHLLAPAGSFLLVAFAGCQCLFFSCPAHTLDHPAHRRGTHPHPMLAFPELTVRF